MCNESLEACAHLVTPHTIGSCTAGATCEIDPFESELSLASQKNLDSEKSGDFYLIVLILESFLLFCWECIYSIAGPIAQYLNIFHV